MSLFLSAIWAFLRRIPWQIYAALLVLLMLWGLYATGVHAGRAEVQAKLDNERVAHKAAIAEWKSQFDLLTKNLADAKKMANLLIDIDERNKAEAEKHLRAREKYWREKYRNDPESKAWSEQPVPPGVLGGLRQHP